MKIHIGGTLRKLLKQKRISSSELAERMGVSQRSVQYWFTRPYLNSELIIKISQVLQYDLIRYLYQPEERPDPTLQDQVDQLKEENTRLKADIEKLEKIIKLMEGR